MPDFDRVPKQSPSLKARALRLLSRREYSRHELAQKLQRLGSQTDNNPPVDFEEQITAILDDFEAKGWLSDERYERAQALWARKFGEISSDQKERAKQYRFLVSKGFNPELVNRLISGRTPSK